MADAPHLDAAAIKSLVEEVVRRITAGAAGPGPAAVPGAPSAGVPAFRPAPAVTLAEAVITLAHVERLPAGAREVAVSARAVITPSARDRARDAGIAFVRSAPASPADPATPRPFVIAHADCQGVAAARAAAVVRFVPRAVRLPATSLADAVAALALHASRDAARGVLLTSRSAVAVILANRSAGLRAVTGRDAATLASAAAEADANLLVVDPAAFAGGLERACAAFASRPARTVPAELAGPPAGCACKSHPH